MKKFISTICLISIVVVSSCACSLTSVQDINTKILQLDINNANLDDVIRVFGEPEKYLWSGKTFTKDNLPSIYIAAYYSNSLYIVMGGGKIIELRFEGQDIGYAYQDKLKIGSSLDEVIELLGKPKETVQGKPNKFKDGVLYRDIEGRKGHCYYGSADKNVRLFFVNYKVTALYLTRGKTTALKRGSFQTVRPVKWDL